MTVLKFLFRYGGRRLGWVALVGVLSGASSAALIALITTLLSSEEARRPSYVAGFSLLVMVVLLGGYLSRVVSIRFTQGINHDLRLDLSRQILRTPLRACEEIGRDKLMATLIEDVQSITRALVALPGVSINAAILLGCLGFIGWLSPAMLGFLVLYLGLAVASVLIPQKRAEQVMIQARADWNRLMRMFQQMTEGEKELRIHRARREAFLVEELATAAAVLRDRRTRSSTLFARINSWIQVVYFVLVGILLFTFDSADTRTLIGFTLAVLYMRSPLSSLVDYSPILAQANASARHMERLNLRLDGVRESDPPEIGDPAPARVLEVRGVTHRYTAEAGDKEFVLGPIDLTLRADEITFITGGNGSGKTTLAKILVGLYTPEQGELLLDGRPIGEEDLEWYRQHFSVVFSESFLFETLLGLGSHDLDLRAGDYLHRLQLEHKVEVSEGALSTTDLSKGQRKRLALLTAYLEDRPIYVFDEWAADQDPTFRRVFYREILPELKTRGKMVVIISHDDRYYSLADHFIKLEYGRVLVDSLRGAKASSEGALGSLEQTMEPRARATKGS